MPKEKSSIKIEDEIYEITLLNTSKAFTIAEDLMKFSLPSLGAAVDGTFFSDEFSDSQTWAAVAIHAVRQSNDVSLLDMAKVLLKGCCVDDVPIEFDVHFVGKMDVLLQVVEFSLKENFGSLFTGTGLVQRLLKYMKEYQAPQNRQELIQEALTEPQK